MAFAAPAVAGRVAAGSAARSAGAGAAAKAAGKSAPKAAGAGAAGKAPRPAATPPAPKPAAVPDRARQLLGEGRSRADVARILRDETGSTLAEAEGLVADVAGEAGGTGDTPAPPAQPAPRGGRRSAPSLPSPPKVIRRGVDAGGGVILGALAYVLALAYIRGGSDGVKAWLRAKFLNQVGGQR